MIDYYCFAVNSIDFSDYIATKDDNDNVRFIKDKMLSELQHASEIKKLVLYDMKNKRFLYNYKPIDVTDKVIMPRCFIPYVDELLTALSQAGAKSIITKTDVKKVEAWPCFIQPRFRKVAITNGEDFYKNLKSIKNDFGDNIFVKSLYKDFSTNGKILDVGINTMFYDPSYAMITKCEKDTKLMVSQTQNLVHKDGYSQEYRVIKLGDKYNISSSYQKAPEPSKEVYRVAEETINRLKNCGFPDYYSFDLFEIYKNGKIEIDIVEFNSLESTCCEIDNTLFQLEPAHLQEHKTQYFTSPTKKRTRD